MARPNVDQILRQIGEFGIFQKLMYLLVNLLGITHGARMMIAEFMLYNPQHRCALPGYKNDTYEVQSAEHESLVNHFVPNATGNQEDDVYDHCHLYSYSSDPNHVATSTEKCDRWVYDTSLFSKTAITEFDLVCDDSLLGSHSQTSQMVGYFIGVLVFGAIGDKFGRKTAMYLSVLVYIVGGIGLAWSPSYAVFVVLRFFNGASSAGAYTAACVLSLEMVGPNKRLWVGVLIHGTFAAGAVVLDFMAYFIRDWTLLTIVATSPAIFALSYWWLIPESPRWLIKKGRTEEADRILRKMAKFNGTHFPEDLMQQQAVSEKEPAEKSDAEGDDTAGKTQGVLRDFLRMFTYRVLLIRNLVLFLNWFAVSMSYYGLSFTADQLAAGDIFTNFLLSMSMDLPANVLVLLLLDRWGRRPLHTVSMVMGGVACLIGVLTTMVAPDEYQWVTVVVAMLGKMGSSAGFILVYIYASELFPTTVRSAGMGVSSAMARLGSIVASYVQHGSLELGGAPGKCLPLLVFGAVCLGAGLLTLLLPETLHKDLPDTVEDGLRFGRDPAKDERPEPVKVVERFTMGNVEIEMESFQSPGDNTTIHTHQPQGNGDVANHRASSDEPTSRKRVNFAFVDDEGRDAADLVLRAVEESDVKDEQADEKGPMKE
ncbi:hypothetical protein BaRGS_00005550 [Batillaria attramentaria]|uniref:Major facilitator superfamily (MFS) profile domain-containing protein n=1 Tax=Batillaria attramentaria TaxID=370345 RepID=A0ABD0LUF5_9CAEN